MSSNFSHGIHTCCGPPPSAGAPKDKTAGLRILVAEDDAVTRALLERTLNSWGFQVMPVADGDQAWKAIETDDPPLLLILDWMMPGTDGLEVCRRLRRVYPDRPTYSILLTAREGRSDLIEGLNAGANDYIAKPFDCAELRARVEVGARVIKLQKTLSDRVNELQEALSRVKQLQGLLPICAYCKKVRDDQNYWQQVEHYISQHSEARFSHGICPDCFKKIIDPPPDAVNAKPDGKS
jgi:sigma-B regulation protein RsbU (phosphoserine phosphatase)